RTRVALEGFGDVEERLSAPEVSLVRECLPAAVADRRRDVARGLAVDVRDADQGAFRREVPGDALAEPAPGAGDQDRLAAEPFGGAGHQSAVHRFVIASVAKQSRASRFSQ